MKKEESGKKGMALKTLSFKKKNKEGEKQPSKSPSKPVGKGPSSSTRNQNKGSKVDKDQPMADR